ncbi:MAG: hypothetical protein IJV50_03010 [Lachnospiraceae bacterium]|nr:hypothetical protein [Lachnospiraceae bacterium]
MTVVLLGSFLYETNFKVTVIDTAPSPDQEYEVILQAVGEPGWPFGSAPGRLVLKKDKTILSKTDFEIANDGGSIGKHSWNITWHDDNVEIVLTGEEQYDELLLLYYDGQVERRRLTTHYGVEKESTSGHVVERETDTAEDLGYELFPGEQQITAGYQAIYALHSDRPMNDFAVEYGASESSSRCVLSENNSTVDYIVYNRRTKNGKCGLYVRYQNEKNSDGTWSDIDGEIVEIYAYVDESGDVVSSGKTRWEDNGSEVYQEATGKNNIRMAYRMGR